MEVLCAYLRNQENTGPFVPLTDNQDVHKWLDGIAPRIDIQAALTILGRRSKWQIARARANGLRLNLTGANLQRLSFEGGNYVCADFSHAHLENARFSGSILSDAQFVGTHLQHARFANAKIFSSSFQHAQLDHTQFSGVVMRDVLFWDVDLAYTNFGEAKLSKVTMLDVSLSEAELFDTDFSGVEFDGGSFLETLGDASTKLPVSVERPDTWPKRILTDDERLNWHPRPDKSQT